MARRQGQLKLGFSLSANGSYRAGWRHPDSWNSGGLEIEEWQDVVRTAERGKFHFIFFADGAAVRVQAKDQDALSYVGKIDQLEPLTLIAALAATSKQIGFVSTASTSFNEPYTIARKFASLDYISHGRVGWNVVTSWSENEAQNFNLDRHIDHAVRYRRAEEFVNVVKGLWDTWDDDAFLRDKKSGRYFEPRKVRELNHKGEFFSVRGPINSPRPLQGYPVIAQAGASHPGKELAARTADIVYASQVDIGEATEYYADVKGRLAKFGRPRDSLLIFPGLMPIVGRTQAEAEDKCADLQKYLHPTVGLSILQPLFGDLSSYPIDGPVPDLPSDTNSIKSEREKWLKRAREKNWSIRQLFEALSMGYGHSAIVGSVEKVADQMQEWFEAEACDGFAVMAAAMPQGVTDFVDLVVPELQRRGLFRNEYEGATLRENLGLKRPPNQFFDTDMAAQ